MSINASNGQETPIYGSKAAIRTMRCAVGDGFMEYTVDLNPEIEGQPSINPQDSTEKAIS